MWAHLHCTNRLCLQTENAGAKRKSPAKADKPAAAAKADNAAGKPKSPAKAPAKSPAKAAKSPAKATPPKGRAGAKDAEGKAKTKRKRKTLDSDSEDDIQVHTRSRSLVLPFCIDPQSHAQTMLGVQQRAWSGCICSLRVDLAECMRVSSCKQYAHINAHYEQNCISSGTEHGSVYAHLTLPPWALAPEWQRTKMLDPVHYPR